MKFASLHKAVTYLLAGLGLYCITSGGQLPDESVLALWLGFGASWFIEEPLLSRPAYGRFWTAAVFVVFVLQFLRGFLGASVIPLGLEYAGFLQLSRLCYRRTARDHQHIAILGFVHLIAASVFSAGLDFAFAFLGFVIVTPWMLSLTHLRAEIEGNYRSKSKEGRPLADMQRVLASRRVAGPRFLLGSTLLSIPLFLVTAGLFLMFPRIGMGFLSFDPNAAQTVTGFGRDIELGRFGVIRDDPTVVLRIRPPQADPGPAVFRLRGTSFDHYDGRRWTRTRDDVEPIRSYDEYYPVDPNDPVRGAQEYQIILDPLDEPVVFLPRGTTGFSVPPRISAGRRIGRQITRSTGLDFRYLDQDALGLTYVAHVSSRRTIADALDAEHTALYLQLPENYDRIAALAGSIVEGARNDIERISRIVRFLRADGDFRYTLQQPSTFGRDPLEVFLFEAKAGHCEYFSTALAIMLRTQGIPTRNVTGFLGGTFNRYGDYYAISQGDAHSWVEAYVEGEWITLEPTPPARDSIRSGDDIFASLRAMLDALRTRWSNDVVGYDLNTQANALRKITRWFRSWNRGVDEATEQTEPTWLWFAIPALVALVAARLWWKGRRPRTVSSIRSELSPAMRKAGGLLRQLDRELERQGVARAPTTTASEHAQYLSRTDHPAASAIRTFVVLYQSVRFGNQELDRDQIKRLEELIEEVARVRYHSRQ